MPLTKNKFLVIFTVLLCMLAIGFACFTLLPKVENNKTTEEPVFAEGEKSITISGTFSDYGTFSNNTVQMTGITAVFSFTANSNFSNHNFALTVNSDISYATGISNFAHSMTQISATGYQLTFTYDGSSFESLPSTIGVTYNPTAPTYGFNYSITPSGAVSLTNLTGVINNDTVTYGTNITFKISANTGYSQLRNLLVKYRKGVGSQSTLSANGSGVYTIAGANITDTIEIFVTVDINTYTLTMPSSQVGYTATVTSNGGTTMTHGVAHTFTVELATGYTNTTPTVSYTPAGGSATTPTRSGSGPVYYYTIPANKVTANITVSITATINTYNFSITTNSNYATTTTGVTSSKVTYGTNVTISLAMNANYNQNAPTVTYTMNGGTITLSTSSTSSPYVFTISGNTILGAIAVTVTPIKNYYTITTNVANDVTLTFISGFRTTTSPITAETGNTITFAVIEPTGYDCTVKVGTTTTLTKSSAGTYSTTVTSNITLNITKTAKSFTFTGASGTGYTFSVTAGVTGYSDGSGTITYKGSAISFSVTLASGYGSSTPAVSYRVNGGAANNFDNGTPSGSTYSYTIASANVTGNIQVFVAGVRMQSYTVTSSVSSTYGSFEGESEVEHGKAYTFTITLAAAYTQSDISSGYVTYSVGGVGSNALTGSLVSGSTATYRYTIPGERTTGSLNIILNGSGLSLNTYTVTVKNEKSISNKMTNSSYNAYYYENDSATNIQLRSANVFAFLFLMNSSAFRTYTSGNTTYYPTMKYNMSSNYYYATFTYTHGANVVIYVRTYMDSSGGCLETNVTSNLAEREVTIKVAGTSNPTRHSSTTQLNNYTISSSISSDYEVTIGLKVATVEFHNVNDYKTSTTGFPSTYSTQIPLTEEEVTTRDNNGTLNINQYAGYTFTSASPSTVNSGDSYTLQLTLLTAKGFSGTPVVKYWYKLRSNGNFSSSGTTVPSSGNNTYNIPANATYSDIYISVSGIQRTQYAVTLPASDETRGYATASVTSTSITYAQNYEFTITVLKSKGWYCNNKNDSGETLLEQQGTPVVTYTMGGSTLTPTRTNFQQASAGVNYIYTYSLKVTGAVEISIGGLSQQTFTVKAIYEDQAGTEYATEFGTVASAEFTGGQITPFSALTVPYGGVFRFSVNINTQEGWNGNGMVVRGKLVSQVGYTTLSKQSDGSYLFSGSTANEDGIVENFIIKISGIVSDSYYITLPMVDGVTLSATGGSQYVLRGNSFSFTATIRADQGWSAGNNNSDLVIKYYTTSNYSDAGTTLVGTYQGDNVSSYTIANVQGSLYVRVVSGLVQAKFRATITTTDASYTTNIDPEQDIIYGNIYEFTVTVAIGYNTETMLVWYKMAGVHDDYVLLTGTNGVYRTIQVIGNITIKIDPAELFYFTALIPDSTGAGFSITYNNGADPDAIPYGASFSCNITKLASHEGTMVVTVTREGVIGTEVINPIEGTGGKYVITNVITNISLSITGLSLKTFEITFTHGDGYTVDPVGKTLTNNKVSVTYGEQLQFKLSITNGYNGSAPSVTDSNTGASYTPAGGIYTISDIVSNVAVGIRQAHSIVISGITLNTYTVSLPSSTEGYTITYDTSLDLSVVPYGTNFVFTVDLQEAYQKTGTFSVKASIGGSAETQLVANGSGEYAVNNIQSNVIISVSGIERKTFSITMPTDEGYTFNRVDGDVGYGSNFTFSININAADGYYEIESGVVVTYRTYDESTGTWSAPQPLTAARGIYTIENVTANISVSVSGIIKGQYKMTLPTETIGFSIVDEGGDPFTDETLTIDYNETFSFKIVVDTTNGYFKGAGFKVSYKVTNSDTTPTQLSGINDIYSIANVINNYVIYVEGVEMTYYTITLPEQEARIGYTIYTNDSTTVAFKQSFTFGVNVDTQNGYDASTLAVYYMVGTERYTLNTISSYTYQMNGITQNRSIVISAPSLQKFNINTSTAVGYEVTSENTTGKVDYDTSYSFRVNIDTENGYNANNLAVYYMPEGKDRIELTAVENVYTISNIKTNMSIIVEGVELNEYEVSFQNLAGIKYWNSNGNEQFSTAQVVKYGDTFEFKVVLDALYNKSTITVYNNTVAISLNAKNNYVLHDITQDCAITVGGVLMNRADYSALESALSISPAYQESYYTVESLNNYKIAKGNAQSTMAETYYQNDQYIIDNTTNALLGALDELQLRLADYSALNAAMANVPENLYNYTEQSRLAVMAAMKNVRMDLDITQQDIVNGYVEVVLDATEGLVPTEEEVNLIQESNFLLYLVGGASVCIIIAMLIIMFIDHKKRNMGGEVFNKKLAKNASNNATNNSGGMNNTTAQNTINQTQYGQYQQQYGQPNNQFGAQNGYNNTYQNGYQNGQDPNKFNK